MYCTITNAVVQRAQSSELRVAVLYFRCVQVQALLLRAYPNIVTRHKHKLQLTLFERGGADLVPRRLATWREGRQVSHVILFSEKGSFLTLLLQKHSKKQHRFRGVKETYCR